MCESRPFKVGIGASARKTLKNARKPLESTFTAVNRQRVMRAPGGMAVSVASVDGCKAVAKHACFTTGKRCEGLFQTNAT
ncbi:MAG: hypothetical protein WCR23_14355, partial [Planctomycetota bacterium]